MALGGDLHRLADYVRDLADRMGLRDYAIFVACGPMETEGHGAECNMIVGQRRATIVFREDWPTWAARNLRQTVAHELLHLHINPLMFGTMMLVEEQLSKAVYDVVWKAADEHLELAVDSIAEAWAETLPLPPKGKKGKV